MAEYLLDTSFLIDLMNGEERVSETHKETRGEQATSTVCVYELSKFDGFEASLIEEKRVLRFSSDDASTAGDVYRSLETKGEPVGETDTMIAGVALSRGLTLVTRDSDFEKIEGLDTLFY
jgi:predicted nucleic acid-binding protein